MIAVEQVERLSSGLVRPECVACLKSGDVFVSHHQGGVTHIAPKGKKQDLLGNGEIVVATNGFSITAQGDFLCANLLPPGGAWRITRDGQQSPIVTEVDGIDLVSVNFVHVDTQDRIWVTVSTRENPRQRAYRPDIASGFIVLVDPRGARIVADDIGYTNEAKVDPSGEWLYVNETFARRTSRYRISANGNLGGRETVTEYGQWVWPDGLDFDVEGGVWISSVLSNKVIRVAPDGSQTVILEELVPDALTAAETAYQNGTMDREHMDAVYSTNLRSVSSITFGGPDLRTAYLGNLLDDCIYTFTSPYAGAPAPHWHLKW